MRVSARGARAFARQSQPQQLPDGLTRSALNAARRIKFTPAEKDGRPVSQFATILYHFNIY